MTAGAEPLVVWINGAFGVGKTSVAEALVPLLPAAILFDPEVLGGVLRGVVPPDEQTDDFQDIPAWRELTRDAVIELAWKRRRLGAVVVPMTLVDDRYFDEIVEGVERQGFRVVHVALIASREVVVERLHARSIDEAWGLARVERCVAALEYDRFATHIDASDAEPLELAKRIAALVGHSRVASPGVAAG